MGLKMEKMQKKLCCIWMGLIVLTSGGAFAEEILRIGSNAVMPQVDGEEWFITDGYELTTGIGDFIWTNDTLPIDFSVWQANDGTWQLEGCVRSFDHPSDTRNWRVFYRWEGTNLTNGVAWEPQGIVMTGMVEYGENKWVLQAPHVLKYDDGKFRKVYGIGNTIAMAESDDGVNFTRVIRDGKSELFPGPSGMNLSGARDPCVLKDGDTYYCYYAVTGSPYGEYPGAILCRTSTNLVDWSDNVIVSTGGAGGTSSVNAECPYIIKRFGLYYLFRSGTDSDTYVYCSDNPLDFGINDDSKYYTGLDLDMDVVEILHHEGQDYFVRTGTNPMSDDRAYRMQKLKWVTPDEDEDGLPDYWERHYYGGATNANPAAAASNGVNTVEDAYIADLNPTNSSSFFTITELADADGGTTNYVIRWPGVTNRQYNVLWGTNLLTGLSTIVSNLPATPPENSYTDTVHGAQNAGFYKVEVEMAE